MAINYEVRKVCETETGDGKGFHYHRETQVDVVDATIDCVTHPSATTRDFVIEREETVV